MDAVIERAIVAAAAHRQGALAGDDHRLELFAAKDCAQP